MAHRRLHWFYRRGQCSRLAVATRRAEGGNMTRRAGIGLAMLWLIIVISGDWLLGAAPDPYRAPDPIALGSTSGGSGAICTFAPPTRAQ